MSDFLTFDPKDLPVPKLHGLMLGGVAPRPIAFASTVDRDGNPNLSPYSFFNVFGSNPPLAIFSPARRVRDNTTKDTLRNAQETGEVVIHTVSYDMVQQVSLSSGEYASGINEFIKAGFSPVPSLKVAPPRVKESPFHMECKVREIIQTGSSGGAGNLIICEVVLIHIHSRVLDTQEAIDPFKLDAVARAGGNWYVRAQGEALFEVPKPTGKGGVGIDALPDPIKNSKLLSGNDLGQLGNLPELPTMDRCRHLYQSPALQSFLAEHDQNLSAEHLAKVLLEQQQAQEAFALLMVHTNSKL